VPIELSPGDLLAIFVADALGVGSNFGVTILIACARAYSCPPLVPLARIINAEEVIAERSVPAFRTGNTLAKL
jgi:hypothetical protein